MKIRAYGRDLLLVKNIDNWDVFELGSEGKKRRARDIIIPGNVARHDVFEYLGDLPHEFVTPKNPDIQLLDS